MRESENSDEIWAVGGGKGGTGKSFFTSLLGIHLASKGQKVILVDCDYGGANLHSFLDLKKSGYTLSDFFDKKIPLREIIMDTHIPNLRLVVGDIFSLNSRSFTYSQKRKLFRHIKKIDSGLVIIDLGAGSSANIVDTFLLADKMIVMTTPQTIAVENLYNFLDKVLFRKLNFELHNHGLVEIADEAWKQRGDIDIKTFRESVYYLSTFSDQIKVLAQKEMADFTLDIVLNQVRETDQLQMGTSLKEVLSSYYGIRAEYPGHIFYNEKLWKHNNRFYTLYQKDPSFPIFRDVERVAQNLLKPRDWTEIPESTRDVPIFLVANTANAVQAMNGRKILEVSRFPFRAGRLSKRKLDNILKNNDYYFKDEMPYTFSRTHFAIVEYDNGFYFQDRGSRFGSVLNNMQVGGEDYHIKEVPLHRGENSLTFGRPSRDLSFTILLK
jgi:flagellar biosynthesis protein FlhG